MYIERILYPVEVLGFGKRIGIWTQGCWHECDKCINPELWIQKERNNVPIKLLMEQIEKICWNNNVDGVTITGGDPLYQFDDLFMLLLKIKQMKLETLVYTGFLRKEILSMKKGKEILQLIDILIDGPYIDEMNVEGLALRGSKNQNIFFADENIEEKYTNYIAQGRKLQNFHINNYIVSVGIHNKPKEK